MAITLAKLAAIAGVSVATASKAFSGSKEISDATRELIFDAAKKHGCYDKYKKARYENYVFALIIPEIRSEYYHRFALAIENEINAIGGTTLISTSGFDSKKVRELFRYYTEFCKVDGIIIIGDTSTVDNSENFPAVCIGGKSGDTEIITLDISSGVNDAVALLKSYGHSKIAFVGESLTSAKESYFREAMNLCGLFVRDEYIFCSKKRFEEAGRDGFNAIFSLSEPPSAVICGYDYIAIGFMDACHENGLVIPDDVSVVGMDNIGFSARSDISLTTIGVNATTACKAAISLLQNKISGKYREPFSNTPVPCEFVVRKSVGRAKAR